ncbi:MAG TPA: 3-oxoadipate enol-lactonase, partial [Candidatus Acidoferrales bacterium]|nr:3-oxoadipate enol-lactonase [Candidatus Acidoferrales bacterium]
DNIFARRKFVMPFAQLSDTKLNYELEGPSGAPVLLFSNSLGANLSMWEQQAAAFNGKYRVIRYDTRGHGQSGVTPGPYSIEQLARDAVALLDVLKIDRADFCGLSMGGQTGMWLGLNAPGRIRKLVLCNTGAKIGTNETWAARMEAVRKGGMASVSEAILERWFTQDFRQREPALIAGIKRGIESTNVEGYLANCVAVRDYDSRETLAAIRIPTLVISGEWDAATPPESGRFIAAKIPGAKYVELNAAHLSNIEAASRFNQELAAFLAA